jgi:hypothetical protein
LEVTDEEPPGGKGIGIGTVNKQHLQYFTTNSALEEIKKLPLQQKLVLCAAWLYKENNKSLSIKVNHVSISLNSINVTRFSATTSL